PGRRGSGRPASSATTASAALALGAADVQIGTASRVSDRRRSGGAAQCCRGCWTRRLQPALRSKHEILIDGCHQWLRAKVEIWDETSASPIFRGRATQELRKVCIGVLTKQRSPDLGSAISFPIYLLINPTTIF